MSRTHTSESPSPWPERARKVLPAGSFGNFESDFVIREGRGSHVWDEQGDEYIDYLIGSGPMIVGHSHPEVISVVEQQLHKGLTFFTNNARGIELAEKICDAIACADQVRFVSTGGEADMYAMRLARAHTGRDKILKFEGGYHGMSAEALMSLAPTRQVDFPSAVPDSAGIPRGVSEHILVAPFNDTEHACRLIDEHARDLAAVIVEPLQRVIPPAPGFLEALREHTRKHGIVLIFDEVVTGFRLAYGGAQSLYGVVPDVCTLGKIIGGGFAMAAVTATQDIMNHFDKSIAGEDAFTLQIGTLSGNPVASVAGLKTMEILNRPGQYDKLNQSGDTIRQTLTEQLSKQGIAHQIVGERSLFEVVFTSQAVSNYRDVMSGNQQNSQRFNRLLRQQGILKSDGKWYMSLALTEDDIAATQQAITYAAQHLLDYQ